MLDFPISYGLLRVGRLLFAINSSVWLGLFLFLLCFVLCSFSLISVVFVWPYFALLCFAFFAFFLSLVALRFDTIKRVAVRFRFNLCSFSFRS